MIGRSWRFTRRRHRAALHLVLVAALISSAFSIKAASASGPLISTGDGSWVWQNPLPQGEPIRDISCPTTSICFAVTGHTVLHTVDAGAHWTGVNPGLPISPIRRADQPGDPYLSGIACPSTNTCYATAYSWVARTNDAGVTWTAQNLGADMFFNAITCPSTTICYAVGAGDVAKPTVFATTDGGATWTPEAATASWVEADSVSCPAVQICYAVAQVSQSLGNNAFTYVGKIAKTSDGGANWAIENSGSGFLTAVSCPSSTVCFAAGANNNSAEILKSVDGGVTWSNQNSIGGTRIACATTNSCYTLNSNGPSPGTVQATQDGGSTWTVENTGISGSSGQVLHGIACPDPTSCYLVGDLGWILSTNSGGSSWTMVSHGTVEDLLGASCPSPSQCFVAGASGTILATTDSGMTWTGQPSGTSVDLNGIACASTTACVAVSQTLALTTSDGGATWTAHPFQFGTMPRVSCPTALLCYATGNISQGAAGYAGTIFATEDGGMTWVPVFATSAGSSPEFVDISCPGPGTCFAGGQAIVRTTDGGATWTQVMASDPGNRFQPSCPTDSVCYTVAGQDVLRTGDGGATWASFVLPQFPTGIRGGIASPTPLKIGCPNATTCYVLASWSFDSLKVLSLATTDGGVSWSLHAVSDGVGPDVHTGQVSCASVSACIAVSAGGAIFSLTSPVFEAADTGRPWSGGSDAVGGSVGATDAYFAEGFTAPNFEEYLTVENPGGAQQLTVDYLLADGTDLTRTYSLSATSRTTIHVNDEVGESQEVSMHLHAANPIVAERPMYFNYPGGITGGDDAVGAASPAQAFYFAEGFTGGGFNEYLTLMNPGSLMANVTVTYLFNQGTAPKAVPHMVPPHSRSTVWVNAAAEAGLGREVSMMVASDQPILAERPMYFNYGGETGGSDVVGATSLLTDMNLAEGHVGQGFDEYLTLLNPNAQAATATVTYYLGSGAPVSSSVNLAPTSRTTIHVNNVLPAGTDSSVHVHSSLPIVLERPMYFTYNGWTGGHDAMAVPDSALSTTMNFAEGYVAANFAEYYTILNKQSTAATVTFTFYLASGASLSKTITVPPNSRWTEKVNNDLPAGTANAAQIMSNQPILAERPEYFAY